MSESEETLTVHVNRDELHALEVPDSFETTGTFDLRLVNHGESVHVHLHLDDALSKAASIDASNHFVDGRSERAVRVQVNGDAPAPVRGKLKVASAYGATTRYVDVQIVEADDQEETVEIDESLSKPSPTPTDSEPSTLGAVASNPEVVVLVLGLVALTVAAAAALVFDSGVVLLGALAVLGAVLVAMYILVVGS